MSGCVFSGGHCGWYCKSITFGIVGRIGQLVVAVRVNVTPIPHSSPFKEPGFEPLLGVGGGEPICYMNRSCYIMEVFFV